MVGIRRAGPHGHIVRLRPWAAILRARYETESSQQAPADRGHNRGGADLAGPRRLRVLVKRRRRERGSEPGDALGASDHERHDRRGNGHTELVRGHPARRRDGRILRDTRRLHGERGLSELEPHSTATSCTDTNVPVGAHKYKVTAVWRSWTSTGVEQTVTVAYGPATHLVLEAASTTPAAGEADNLTSRPRSRGWRADRHRLGRHRRSTSSSFGWGWTSSSTGQARTELQRSHRNHGQRSKPQ